MRTCEICGAPVEGESCRACEAATAPDTMECPRCAETIKARAKACRFCGLELDPGATYSVKASDRQRRIGVESSGRVTHRRRMPLPRASFVPGILLGLLIAAAGGGVLYWRSLPPYGLTEEEYRAVVKVWDEQVQARERAGVPMNDKEKLQLLEQCARIAKEQRGR